MTTETIGLIVNFFGALVLAIGTGIQTEISMDHLKITMNYPGSPHGMVQNAVKRNMAKLRIMRIAKWIIYCGYALFIFGFAMQVIQHF